MNIKKYLWIALGALILGYLIHAFITIDKSNDNTQINKLIANTVKSITHRNLSDAMDAISTKYKDSSGLNHDRLRLLAAQILRDDQKYFPEYNITDLQINENKAVLAISVIIKSEDGNILYEKNLDITLEKENTRQAIIFPTKTWKIISIDNLGLDILD